MIYHFNNVNKVEALERDSVPIVEFGKISTAFIIKIFFKRKLRALKMVEKKREEKIEKTNLTGGLINALKRDLETLRRSE